MNRKTGGAASASGRRRPAVSSPRPGPVRMLARSPVCRARVTWWGMAWTTRSRYSRWGVPGGVPSHRMKRAAPERILGGQGDHGRPTGWPASLRRAGPPAAGCCRFAAGTTASVGPLIELGAPSQMRAAAVGRMDGASSRSPQQPRSRAHPPARCPRTQSAPDRAAAIRSGLWTLLRTSDFCSSALRPHLRQVRVPHLVRQPDHLERAVAFERAGHVVVDAFAGPREQARRRVVLVHDQVGVGLVALEGDADDHLAEGGAGHGVGAAQGLRAEQHVDAEGPALAHDPVQQQRRASAKSCRPRRRTPGTRR